MSDRAAGSRVPPSHSDDGRPFTDPPWEASVDVERCLAGIPADATISGMFFTYLAAAAKAMGVPLSSAGDRYVAFKFYPVSDLARLLLEAVPLLFPGRPLRQALRALGRGAPDAFLSSTLGKVTLGSNLDPHAAISAIAGAYEVNLRPSRVRVLDKGPGWATVGIEKVHYFLDSHHVGTFEGVLKHASAQGTVRIASRSASSADLLLQWQGR